jgi:hypothetical protein
MMEEMVAVKYVLLLAIDYAISFFIFGWLGKTWYDDWYYGRKS